MTARRRPTKTLKPPPRKVRLRLDPLLTKAEQQRLRAQAQAEMRSLANLVVGWIEPELARDLRTKRRVRAGPGERLPLDLGIGLTVRQRDRLRRQAEREGRSVSNSVGVLVVRGLQGRG